MNKKLIIGIIAAVVALALVVIGIISITGGLGSKDPSTSNPSSSTPSGSQLPSVNNPENNIIEGEKTEISADKKDTETIITVPIKLSNNTGVGGAQLFFTYDTDALVYVDYGKGDIFDEHMIEESKGGIACISSTSQNKDIVKDGTLLTLSFKVKENAKPGEYEIKIDKSKTKFASFEEKYVKPTLSTGKITIK